MTRIRTTLGIATLLWLAGTATTRSSGTDPFAFMVPAVGLEETERSG
jgi:hypothetical protein